MALSSFRLIVLVLGVCLFAFESEALTFAEIYFSNITESSGTFNDDLVNSVVLDSRNATYITGSTEAGLYTANATGGTDLIVGKYIAAPSGNLTRVWGQQIGSVNSDVGYKIIISSDESTLIVAGTYDNSPALFELNATNGDVIKSFSYSNYSIVGSFIPRFTDLAPCGSETLCAVGGYPFNSAPVPPFAVRFNSSGPDFTVLWAISEVSTTSTYSSVAYASTGRLFIAGDISLPGVGKEFYLKEINVNTGANITQRIWPGTTCGSRENYITDIAIDEANNTLYFIGSSNQEFEADGTPSATVCDFSSACMAAGSLSLDNFSQVHWMYNLSALEDGGLVETSSLSLGEDGYLYIVGDSDAASLLGQQNAAFAIGGGYFDWYLLTLDGSTGLIADFMFQGDASYILDDKTGSVDVDTPNGRIAIGYNTGSSSKNDINIRLGSNTPELFASPTPSASASPPPPVAESSSPADDHLPLIVGVVLGSAVVGLVGLVLFFIIRKKKDEEKRRKRGSQIRPDPEKGSANSVRMSVLEGINRNSALLQDNWNISYQEIELGAEIGRGAYGTVFRGKWRGSTVAVKQLNLEKTDQRAIDDFVKEASAVKRLRNHRNVCQIFGVCADPEYPICIVMEYMEDGNLQNLVYKGKVQLDVDAVLSMAKHTASGMSHLHSENILHCDLACRNLLVSIGKGNKYLVKISDFGMARVVENEKIYNASSEAQFPVRWSAPEVLASGTVSRKSDVWSFGITVWEMIEGVKPYYELASNKEVIEYVVVNGYRLPRPKKVEIPTALWEILNQCWSANPAERPEFDEILKKLSNMKKMLRASSRGTPHDVTVTGAQPKPTGEIKPGGETYLTISEFKKKDTEPVNSDEEYNTLGEKKNSNNNTRPAPPPKVVEEEDTYNKVNVKLTAQDVNGEDDYKAVIHLKADSQQAKHKPAVSQSDDDTYNKINFKNEFAAQNGNNNADESDYTQINKPIFGGPAQPAKSSPPPRVVEESDYTARVNVSNEFASSSQASNSDDYSTVRLNTTQAKPKQQQQPVEEDNYSKVVLKSNSSSNNDESDYNVINFNNQNDRKQSNVQDLYLNNKK